jgi:LPS-assembly lipoprotein
MIRIVALCLMLMASLSACGLRPLYGGASTPARQTLGAIEVGGIPGRAGFMMRGALEQRLSAAGNHSPRYRLEVALSDEITGFGVRADNAVTRERRTLRARYQLIALDRGTVVLDATAGADAGIDVVSSEFATIAAEDSALQELTEQIADQIVSRIALFASRPSDRRGNQPGASPQ